MKALCVLWSATAKQFLSLGEERVSLVSDAQPWQSNDSHHFASGLALVVMPHSSCCSLPQAPTTLRHFNPEVSLGCFAQALLKLKFAAVDKVTSTEKYASMLWWGATMAPCQFATGTKDISAESANGPRDSYV